ncbi:Aldo/keto reductase [Lasiodiplodia theobromae]|uniref:Aldo/keto reductase n=1 Tax=Lasiodiplodia theobromae TaxID=45133 RepID=A0A8H7IP87_9PEZI|nr:L-galactose dehydrogenase [Lasiodiplodia theobromae]KAF4543932.1 L-galactose dehydrogenase [Lasiodiplodia theobromae]KAF9629293.1 Aldo/keto reductase [Lasiodiplodia theobromae]
MSKETQDDVTNGNEGQQHAPQPTTTTTTARPPLSSIAPALVLGGAGFSNQLHPNPASLPTRHIVQRALDVGFRAIDTSPYYGPSEVLLGDALAQPELVAAHPRDSFLLMTKCGRIAADHFDYSPAWIRQSVARSLERLHTTYLDVVFTHDVEFVSVAEAVAAVGALFALRDEGKLRYVGISGYPLPRLVEVARAVRERYGCGVDAVQVWGQLTLQNTVLLDDGGLAALRDAGVDCVFASSPLAIGLLRRKGVPVGELGDFHPAPPPLREAAARASDYVEERHTKLAELALKYAVARGLAAGEETGLKLSTILGGGTTHEIEDNWEVGSTITKRYEARRKAAAKEGNGDGRREQLSGLLTEEELEMVKGTREIFGQWLNHSLGG